MKKYLLIFIILSFSLNFSFAQERMNQNFFRKSLIGASIGGGLGILMGKSSPSKNDSGTPISVNVNPLVYGVVGANVGSFIGTIIGTKDSYQKVRTIVILYNLSSVATVAITPGIYFILAAVSPFVNPAIASEIERQEKAKRKSNLSINPIIYKDVRGLQLTYYF